MTKLAGKRQKIAIILLCIWSFNMLLPGICYALTSGPAQPETKGFQVAGVSDMVDLQSGDLKYNIPLLDIDGYPINLSYQSGVGIDDESSWVGLGWSLNPGAINRQVRGIPDDFSGDSVETDHYVKPKITVGGRLTGKAEFGGIAKVSGSFTFGVFSDNYTGIGAELGVNAGISYAFTNDGFLTAGLGAGVLSNTQSGVDLSISPYINMSVKSNTDNNLTTNAGLSGSFGYNTRSGLKALTLGESFGASNYEKDNADKVIKEGGGGYSIGGSTITYNTAPVSPSIQVPFTSDYSSFSFDVGGEAFALFISAGGTGYRNVRQVKAIYNTKPAFGFLYAERGKDNPDAVMDFIREKDNPIIPTIPNIALPIHTPDIWSYTSQSGGGQFRLFRGGTGMFFDNQAQDVATTSTTGGDIGVGAWVHAGVTHYDQNAKTTTRKWTSSNAYLAKGDFQVANNTNPNAEQVYFRQVGEKNVQDEEMDTQLKGTQPLEITLQGVSAQSAFRNAGNISKAPAYPISLPIAKAARRPNRTVISYLTAAEATYGALNKKIPDFGFRDSTSYTTGSLPASPTADSTFYRMDTATVAKPVVIHKPHHISEMTVTDDGGKRMVYGIPVYNTTQDEYSFAIDTTSRDKNNLVAVPSGITSPTGDPNGIDNYYHKEHKPSYATSYLLTAILSPDYVDKTGDGITDDDLGTAIKFNYSKLPYYYKWRTPYAKATPNRGLMADPDDDKGSIIYGQKEIWYVQSIESKTKIAYFITQDRRDALGVAGWQNGGRDVNNKQKCLREIRLYSKADMTRPIKVVKFKYTYELCRGIPNSADFGSTNSALAGKLTLSKVWFEYGNTDKGKYHPYLFQYNKTSPDSGTVKYAYSVTDRWGIYKPSPENPAGMGNEQYPYTNQNKTVVDANCALWHLSQITLPTGGIVNVSYESGDYAYVQNQRAMVMSPVKALVKLSSDTVNTSLPLANGIRVVIPAGSQPPPGADPTSWFKNNYLNGSNYIYAKLCVSMATNNYNHTNPSAYDFVPTYCLVQSVTITPGFANIMLTPITEGGVTVNPMSISAWQRMKNEYPRYAYPGFDNRVQTNSNSILAAVSSIVNAAKNLSELKRSFYQKALADKYASQVYLGNSFVKLVKADGFKLGGSARVKKIQINDTWSTTGTGNVNSAYGQSYTYTTIDNGKTISSGVATYEPAPGNDENALKQPVPYVEHIKGAINNYFDLELPFGESLYPAPAIGYSKVTVTDIGASGNPVNKTGSVVSEFYTAKDFPVKVTALPLINYNPRPSSHYSLMSSNSDDELALSQGYSIELNDMHGKPKATRVFNQAGAEISSTVYSYNTKTDGAGVSLNNSVKVIDPGTLAISTKTLGRDIDFFTDFREQETSNKGRAINVGGDVFPIPLFLPFFALPHVPINDNNDYKLFRSACAVKVIQNYGILSKVVKTENGSSITTENLAYDALTGEALVTRTKNEFKQNIYTTNIPAYWAYNGMGAAYKNLGVLLSGLSTNANGEITSGFTSYLHGGDEIMDTGTGDHYWVIDNLAASGVGTSKKLIPRDGTLKKSATIALGKVVRSGYRNMLGASTTTLVSLNPPFTTDNLHLQLISSSSLAAMKVINASATTFDENWAGSNCCNLKKISQPTSDPILTAIKKFDRDYSVSYTSPDASGIFIGDTFIKSPYWGGNTNLNVGRREVISFWPTEAQSKTYGPKDCFDFDVIVTFPESKVYYFVITTSGDNSFYLDCTGNETPGWIVDGDGYDALPLFVQAGKHIIHGSFTLSSNSPLFKRNAGLEIYNNTSDELINADSLGTGLNILFSTKDFVGNDNIYDAFNPNGFSNADSLNTNISYHFTRPDGLPLFYNFSYMCPNSPDTNYYPKIVNPYVTGFAGNWRPYQTKVFQQSRNYSYAGNYSQSKIDVKNAGYINSFYSYWYLNGTTWTRNPNGSRWITANTVTLYDKYGQQLENKDALGRFSAANFDFNGELPSAVASNAMNREIYSASLEDYKFIPGSAGNTDTCNIREFIQPSNHRTLKQMAVNTIAHSGNYSALLPAEGVTLSTIIDTVHQKTVPYLALDAQKQYITQTTTGLYPNGFEPYPNKKYLFNSWVNDGLPNDRSINLTLNINGNNVPLKCKAVVEGWKLMEGTMDLSTISTATALNISLVPTTGHTIYIDDIRMHPFDAQMKSYAYDDKTMRLMAEIDENGFATFYEYDDEGLLVRVKKETEKGIMTLKESKSSYRKNTTP
jgi:hypothetical protein